MSGNAPADGKNAAELVARWQYAIVWRYGALLLILVGLGLIACALAGVTAVIPAALLPIGFAALVAGVVLPRVKGRFSGPGKVGADLLGVHELDMRPAYRYTSPSVEAAEDVAALPASSDDSNAPAVVTMADVIRALRAAPNVESRDDRWTTTYVGPDGSSVQVPVHGTEAFFQSKAADDLLLRIVRDWDIGIQPTGQHLQ
jgi:hypothetical protein